MITARHLTLRVFAALRNAPLRVSETNLRFPRLLVLWVSIAALLVLAQHLIWLNHPFTDHHGWGSSQQAVMARAFVRHGVLALGGVPIQNNPPIGNEPDLYTHWPPLPPILLSIVFRVFGESEAAGHGLMLVILLANCMTLYALARTRWDARVAMFAVFGALLIPVTVKYGHVLTPQHLAILGIMSSLIGFIKGVGTPAYHQGWAWFGAFALAFGVLSSWELLLLPPGLLAVAVWRRDGRQVRLALLYGAVAAATFVGLIVLYVAQAPALAADLWHTLLMRAGFTSFQGEPSSVHTVVNKTYYAGQGFSFFEALQWYRVDWRRMLGWLPMISLGWVLVEAWRNRSHATDGRAAFLFGGLLAPWLLWFVLMSNQAARHDFMFLLGVPAASVAMGLGAVKLIAIAERASGRIQRRVLYWLVWGVLPALMLFNVLININARLQNSAEARDESKEWTGAYAYDIKGATEPGAVVMVPTAIMIPVYYSERHLIRGITNDSVVESVVARLPEAFPGSPAYLALSPVVDNLDRFSQSMQRFRVVKRTPNLILLEVHPARTSDIKAWHLTRELLP